MTNEKLFETMFNSAMVKVRFQMEVHDNDIEKAIAAAKTQSCAGSKVWDAIRTQLEDEAKKTVEPGQLVIAKDELDALGQAKFRDGVVVDGVEEPIFRNDTGRVINVSRSGSRVLVNWRGRRDLFGWCDLEDLEIAETHEFKNVTIFFPSEFYGVNSVFCKSLVIERAPYAQYRKATKITWKAPRQRKARTQTLAHNQALVIVDGQAPSFENFSAPRAVAEGVSVSSGLYRSFDPRWSEDMFKHADNCGQVLYAQSRDGEAAAN